jgi:predicted DNA-binding protein with PD1-like motif
MANASDVRYVPGPLEIVSLCGSISADGVHLHMTVANAAGEVVGGHVCAGCDVRTTAELLVADIQGYTLTRELDAQTGFRELLVHANGRESNAA